MRCIIQPRKDQSFIQWLIEIDLPSYLPLQRILKKQLLNSGPSCRGKIQNKTLIWIYLYIHILINYTLLMSFFHIKISFYSSRNSPPPASLTPGPTNSILKLNGNPGDGDNGASMLTPVSIFLNIDI